MKQLIAKIGEQEGLHINSYQSLSGGDINAVFLCRTAQESFVLKTNSADRYPEMFQKEAEGLKVLRDSDTFLIPAIIACGIVGTHAYLILEYLLPDSTKNWSDFGQQLAQLHQCTAPTYGFPEWNYIGRLQQYNDYRKNASEFLITQRLEPQFRLARESGFSFRDTRQLCKVISQLIPEEKPALIHGDLWNGNYLTTQKGFALIDPAVSYSLREMDLAMMQLFGGFPAVVFDTYEHYYPTPTGLDERIPIYQLYYLLVHLNLFGGGYYQQCKNIVDSYR